MSRHKNLMTRICCAAVLSLGLAACGGKTVTPATPMAPTPVAPTPVVVTPVDPAALDGGAGCGRGGEDGG